METKQAGVASVEGESLSRSIRNDDHNHMLPAELLGDTPDGKPDSGVVMDIVNAAFATIMGSVLTGKPVDTEKAEELKPVLDCLLRKPGADPDAFKRYKVKCRERHDASLNTPERLAQHNAIMQRFIGDDVTIPNPGPLMPSVSERFNPLFSEFWKPWAKKVQYIGHDDLDLSVCGGEGSQFLRLLTTNLLAWAVPTLPVLKFMVDNAPNRKIAEIGSGKGYWSALLSRMGADMVAVDDGSELGGRKPTFFPHTVVDDGVEFVQRGSADDRALFFCWARPGDMPARCIEAYKGDTVFFVGENGGDNATFDVFAWLRSQEGDEWQVAAEMEIPTWVSIHDYFMMCKRVSREQGQEEEIGENSSEIERHRFSSVPRPDHPLTPHSLRYLRLHQISSSRSSSFLPAGNL